MAKTESKQKTPPKKVSIVEIINLADRLQARADRIENLGTADLVRDLRELVEITRAMLRSFNKTDSITLDE